AAPAVCASARRTMCIFHARTCTMSSSTIGGPIWSCSVHHARSSSTTGGASGRFRYSWSCRAPEIEVEREVPAPVDRDVTAPRVALDASGEQRKVLGVIDPGRVVVRGPAEQYQRRRRDAPDQDGGSGPA